MNIIFLNKISQIKFFKIVLKKFLFYLKKKNI